MKIISEKTLAIITAAAKASASVSGIFCFIVCILMIANAIQLATTDPFDNPALVDLRSRYSRDQDNESLRDEIRGLDLLARKGFFNRQWQLRVGAYMLIGGAVVFLLSMRVVSVIAKRRRSTVTTAEASAAKALPRRVFFSMGGLLLVSAVAAIFLTNNSPDGSFASNLGLGMEGGLETSWERFAAEMAGNWPAFRGPYSNGIGNEQKPPVDWDGGSGRNVLWKAEIPLPGFGSPIVWDNRVFLSGADESNREVYCWDVESGRLLWRSPVGPYPGSPEQMPDFSTGSGYAAPTMATDGKRVFAIFANADLVCLDFSGRTLWGVNLGLPDNVYGYSSSLLVYGTLLIVQLDDEYESELIAVDTLSGQIEWTTEREVLPSWSSPLLADTEEQAQVVISGNPYLAAYDPATGSELWRYERMRGEVASSPAYGDGRIIAVNQTMSIIAVDPTTGELLWQVFDDLPDTSSPLVAGDLVIIGTSFGVITCYRMETGEIVWKEQLPEGFYASPVWVDEKVFLMDRAGTMRIFEADESFSLIASPGIGEASDATPAFKDGLIFIRGETHLFCIGELE